jgi:hypothetical protein
MGLTVDVHLCSQGMYQKLPTDTPNGGTVPSQGVSNYTATPSLRGNYVPLQWKMRATPPWEYERRASRDPTWGIKITFLI